MGKRPIARRLDVNGIVQGVGFRPFVYNLAIRHHLKGEVANTPSGVSIHVEGLPHQIESFVVDLTKEYPPLAHVVEVSQKEQPLNDFTDFSIGRSHQGDPISTLISPDVSICEDCLRELFDPNDRRYRYPFINCINCGPRYTIIRDMPYDRPKTSMHVFRMCPKCQAEYDNPKNRRFHAQPNACEVCGPHLDLFDNRHNSVEGRDSVKKTAALLKRGFIIAVKGLGGFHLVVDAANDAAVKRLRRRKNREEKPFALMSLDLEAICNYAESTAEEQDLLVSAKRPIVLLRKKVSNPISPHVAPSNHYFGVMLPYTPLHYLLLEQGFVALVMTSGNLTEEPIAIDNEDAFHRLGRIADYFLLHNRDIYLRNDDSVVRIAANAARVIRRSRGYVPAPVFLNDKTLPAMGVGAELKNTICVVKEDKAFLSQHIGDLENVATYEFFQLTIRHMTRILDVRPEVIAYDMHPDYLSTRWALEQKNAPAFAMQHHHAHIVSAMAENRIGGPVIGLAFDGTGYGIDGTVWGGEVLITDFEFFERVAHLATVPMPGNTAAIKQPWRMAVSYLSEVYGEDMGRLSLPMLTSIEEERLRIVREMTRKRFNAPLTSSMGRLFDGVAAILNLRTEVAFEGQAAMELEMVASGSVEGSYDYDWHDGDPIEIFPHPIIEGVVKDIESGLEPKCISAKFHASLILLFTELCIRLRKQRGLSRVVLSGGVFQNVILLNGLIWSLTAANFEVFAHRLVPCNDGGISLGQAVVAAAKSKTQEKS